VNVEASARYIWLCIQYVALNTFALSPLEITMVKKQKIENSLSLMHDIYL